MSFLFVVLYAILIVFFWNQASEYFEIGENTQGFWNLFLSAMNGALLGMLLI